MYSVGPILCQTVARLSQTWNFQPVGSLLYLLPTIFQVNKYAFSGGQDSVELHRKLGANLEVRLFLLFEHFLFRIY
jgi:hypothetical protein